MGAGEEEHGGRRGGRLLHFEHSVDNSIGSRSSLETFAVFERLPVSLKHSLLLKVRYEKSYIRSINIFCILVLGACWKPRVPLFHANVDDHILDDGDYQSPQR